MLRTIYLSFLCCTCLYFTACEKTAIEDMIAEEVVVEVQNLEQDIVFLQSIKNLETNTVAGWLVDGKGEVKTYEMPLADYPLDKPTLSGDELYRVVIKSKNVGSKVDFAVLEAHFNNLKAVEKTALTEVEENADQFTIATTIAYREIPSSGFSTGSHSDEEECGDESDTYTDEDYFEKLILEEVGQRNRLNTSDVVQEMLIWLKQMEGNL